MIFGKKRTMYDDERTKAEIRGYTKQLESEKLIAKKRKLEAEIKGMRKERSFTTKLGKTLEMTRKKLPKPKKATSKKYSVSKPKDPFADFFK